MPDQTTPLYTIGIAAELLDVHPRTLRLYEESGLLRPARRNNRRLYTNHDVMWVRCIRHLIHKQGLNQEGLRRLLALIPCWNIRGCSAASSNDCPARSDRSAPCWHLTEINGRQEQNCYDCPTYLSAPEHVCSPEELASIQQSNA